MDKPKTPSEMAPRELDAAVAEKVMGWKMSGSDFSEWEKPDGTTVGDPVIDHWSPSTDVATDYTVLVKVRETWSRSMQNAWDVAYNRLLRAKIGTVWRDPATCLAWPSLAYQPGDYSRAALSALSTEGA